MIPDGRMLGWIGSILLFIFWISFNYIKWGWVLTNFEFYHSILCMSNTSSPKVYTDHPGQTNICLNKSGLKRFIRNPLRNLKLKIQRHTSIDYVCKCVIEFNNGENSLQSFIHNQSETLFTLFNNNNLNIVSIHFRPFNWTWCTKAQLDCYSNC